MDNQTIDVVSEGGPDQVDHALALIWNCAAPGGKATHYKIIKLVKTERQYYIRRKVSTKDISNVVFNGEELCVSSSPGNLKEHDNGVATLILLWHEENGSKELPFPLDRAGAVQLITQFLNNANYGPQPDHDGDNEKGWRIFTEGWGHVAGHRYAIVAVQPAWAMYGK